MAGTCGMMGGRRRKGRGGQPPGVPSPTAPSAATVQAQTSMEKDKNIREARLLEQAKTKKNFPALGRGRTRKLRGGNGYGFTATPGDVINAGNIAWTPNMTSVPNGQPVVGSVTGGRRRKSRKASKKGRKRTMKGGGSVANVGYGFAGTGARGIADAVAYPSNLPPSGAFAIPTGTR